VTRFRLIRLALIGTLVALAIAGIFALSVAMWGSWWRVPRFPQAEEWSALYGGLALIAVVIAGYQIRQVDTSNREVSKSNEALRLMNRESIRPRVLVDLAFHRAVRKQRGMPVEGDIYLIITNIGPTTASQVRLGVDVPFDGLDRHFAQKQAGRYRHFSALNGYFDGTVVFQVLAPAKRYQFFLGHFPDTIDDSTGVPRRYEVVVTYKDTILGDSYKDEYVLDLDLDKRLEIAIDPLTRVGKDLEVVSEELKKIRQSIPDALGLDDEQLRAVLNSVRARKTSRAPSIRAARTLRRAGK